MAIVKATYTKSSKGAKASIRYIEHRPGREGEKITRTLFNSDGLMGRWQANRMIDEAAKGSLYYRIVISPDPKQEDTTKDLSLRDITEQTMMSLEEQLQQEVQWVAAVHDDHAPHRHMHVVAIGETLGQPKQEGVRDVQIGNCQAWYYHGNKILEIWECYLWEGLRTHPFVADPNMQKLWQGLETWLVKQFPQATRMVTPCNDPIAHSIEEYQTFLRSLGFESVAKAAFGKPVKR